MISTLHTSENPAAPSEFGARNIYDPDHVKAKNLWYSVLAEPQKTDRLEIACWRTHLTTRYAGEPGLEEKRAGGNCTFATMKQASEIARTFDRPYLKRIALREAYQHGDPR